ncbi:MAG: hypothetical protein WBQ94_03540 [Terracidiphilus sp.]
MASLVTELAAEAIELDQWVEEIPDYQAHFDRFLTRLEKGAHKMDISNATEGGGTTRSPMRVPFRAQGGAAIAQMSADTSGTVYIWQRGSGSYFDGFTAAPVRLNNVCEISNLTLQATDGKDRGLVKIKREELQNSLKVFDNGVEGLIHRDGSGTIDQIPTTATVNNATGGGTIGTPTYSSIVGLNTAASFQDQQVVQVLSAVGGTNRGSFTISYVDPVAQTIYCTAALPSGTTTGDILVVSGATGAAGSSILGKDYWLANGNTGTIGGIPKANYPGRLSTPTINFGSTSGIANSTGERVQAIRMRAMGDDYDQNKEGFWLANPAQGVPLSNLFYNVGYTRLDEGNKEHVEDTTRKFMQKTLFGEDVVWATTAEPTRMDYIIPDTWYFGELFPTRLHEWTPGNTIAAVPAIGQAAGSTYFDSTMFAYERGFQLVCNDPKENFYFQNLPPVTL